MPQPSLDPAAEGAAPPTPERFLETLQGYQHTAALQAAVELDLFTAIDDGADTAPALAERVEASERGVSRLADYLTVLGFLAKEDGRYRLAPDAAAFLSHRSPACMLSVTRFLLHPTITKNYADLTAAVRRGGGPPAQESGVAKDWPTWVEFARSMMPLMAGAAESLADLITARGLRPQRVLDLAAGHGLYGIAVAQRHPDAQVTAVDWEPVLAVARANAEAAGVADRLECRPGDVFGVPFGDGQDLVLVANLLHHYDVPTCEELLGKVRAALAPQGLLAIVEFVPDEDRVSPRVSAKFALQMLAGTPSGDAYTFSELDGMLRRAGFTGSECLDLPRSRERVVLSWR